MGKIFRGPDRHLHWRCHTPDSKAYQIDAYYNDAFQVCEISITGRDDAPIDKFLCEVSLTSAEAYGKLAAALGHGEFAGHPDPQMSADDQEELEQARQAQAWDAVHKQLAADQLGLFPVGTPK